MLEFLGIALFILALILAGFTWWVIRYLLIKLPEQQKDILARFSPQVVNQVLLEYASLSNHQQRQIAEEKMRNIFEDQRIDPAGEAMIGTAIADAMYKQKRNEADEWIEELKADQLSQEDTASLPVTPKEEFML